MTSTVTTLKEGSLDVLEKNQEDTKETIILRLGKEIDELQNRLTETQESLSRLTTLMTNSHRRSASNIRENTSATFLDLPLLALGSIDNSDIMKFKGTVDGQEVIIMVDSGASKNFIASGMTDKLDRPIEPTPRFGVRLGDGRREVFQGKYSNLPITIGSETLCVDCLLFPLGGVDIILGVPWLASLGDVIANWKSMFLSFTRDGPNIRFNGDPPLARSEISTRGPEKLHEVDHCA